MRETLSTVSTLERLFTTVNTNVLFEVVLRVSCMSVRG